MKKFLIVILALILVVVLGVSAVIACVYMWRDGEYNNAMELLKTTNTAVEEIAAAVGFNDPLYFSRVFREVKGVPPSAYQHEE